VRETDRVVRWGGEEFVVVAMDTEREEVPALAERIRAAVASTSFEVGPGGPLQKTVSIGFVVLPLHPGNPDWPSWEQALSLADQCLYLTKAEGRDRWVGAMPCEAPVEGSPLPTADLTPLEAQGWVALVRGPARPGPAGDPR
jgi:diguanylate cyclase (GGDEF)-like protein